MSPNEPAHAQRAACKNAWGGMICGLLGGINISVSPTIDLRHRTRVACGCQRIELDKASFHVAAVPALFPHRWRPAMGAAEQSVWHLSLSSFALRTWYSIGMTGCHFQT